MEAGFGVKTALILIGFTATIAQVVLMRELMVLSAGNEISIGVMLASWLFWTAAGSSLAGRVGARTRDPRRWMAGLEVLVALALPVTILAVRGSQGVLQRVAGESSGPGTILLASLAALSLFCLASGALFTTGSRVYAKEAVASTGEATGSVYLLEALGSGLGGILAGVLLLRHFGPLEIAGVVGTLNLLAAASLVIRGRFAYPAVIGALLGSSAFLLVYILPAVETESLQSFWRGFHLVAMRTSLYGNLAVVETEGSRSLYENGLILSTAPDPAAAEEAVHYALLEHPSPRSLLLIGGGLNGSPIQALQHASLERVDYVELDPAILDVARAHFSSAWTRIEADRRVRVHVTDGRLFLKTTSATFDVIIVNLPDPQTAQLNRFYTVEFFREAAARLTREGILSFQLTAAEDYISPELGAFLRSIYKTLRQVFPEVKTMPGATVHFFATRQPGVLAANAGELLARLRARRLPTSYVREYYIPFRMMPDRMLDLESQIEPHPDTPVNQDFAPIAYYFNTVLWTSRFHPAYRRFFHALAGISFNEIAAGTAAILLALGALAGSRANQQLRWQATASFCTAATGFTMIGLEILVLLAFQAIYGYVYHQLAIVIAAFMTGTALGSLLALRPSAMQGPRALACVQTLVALAPLLAYALFEAVRRSGGPSGAFVMLFPGMALCAGLLGGYEFPLASRIFFASRHEHGTGILYAVDLAGACVGAVLFSAWLVPVFGFLKTALLIALVSMAPAVLALWSHCRVAGSGRPYPSAPNAPRSGR